MTKPNQLAELEAFSLGERRSARGFFMPTDLAQTGTLVARALGYQGLAPWLASAVLRQERPAGEGFLVLPPHPKSDTVSVCLALTPWQLARTRFLQGRLSWTDYARSICYQQLVLDAEILIRAGGFSGKLRGEIRRSLPHYDPQPIGADRASPHALV